MELLALFGKLFCLQEPSLVILAPGGSPSPLSSLLSHCGKLRRRWRPMNHAS